MQEDAERWVERERGERERERGRVCEREIERERVENRE